MIASKNCSIGDTSSNSMGQGAWGKGKETAGQQNIELKIFALPLRCRRLSAFGAFSSGFCCLYFSWDYYGHGRGKHVPPAFSQMS